MSAELWVREALDCGYEELCVSELVMEMGITYPQSFDKYWNLFAEFRLLSNGV